MQFHWLIFVRYSPFRSNDTVSLKLLLVILTYTIMTQIYFNGTGIFTKVQTIMVSWKIKQWMSHGFHKGTSWLNCCRRSISKLSDACVGRSVDGWPSNIYRDSCKPRKASAWLMKPYSVCYEARSSINITEVKKFLLLYVLKSRMELNVLVSLPSETSLIAQRPTDEYNSKSMVILLLVAIPQNLNCSPL